MKSLIHFAIFLALSLKDINHIHLRGFDQHDNAATQINYNHQDFIKKPSFSLILDNTKAARNFDCRSSILQHQIFRNQLLDNFSNAMLKNLRKPQPVLATALNSL